MPQSKSQSSNIFEAKNLKLTKKGVIYKPEKPVTLERALRNASEGKTFKSIGQAIRHTKKRLEEQYG